MRQTLEDAVANSALVTETIRRARDLTEPMLHSVVERLPPRLARISGYHFGWCHADGGSVTASPCGKGVRPALAFLSAEAVRSGAETALAGAVAVELIHNFSLIHDDIIDRDERRRNRATLWKVYGNGPAILIGDALHTLALHTLLLHGGQHAAAAASCLTEAMLEVVHGQDQDIEYCSRPWTGTTAVSIEEYRSMAGAKTGGLLACATSIGALLAGGTDHDIEQLAAAGHHLGIAFQCMDDVIGLWGDPAVTGKPRFGDLREARKTLPILAAASSGTICGNQLIDLLTSVPQGSAPSDLEALAQLAERAGGRDYAHQEARRQLGLALELLDAVAMPQSTRAKFTALARYLIDRAG